VLQSYQPGITLIAQPNGGQGAAYCAGFERATGEIIIFLDADDWLYASAAAEIVAVWGSKVSKVQFNLALVDREGAALGRLVPRSLQDREASAVLARFGTYASPPGSGNAFCARFLRQIFPFDYTQWRIAADTVPIMLAPMYGEIVSLHRPLGAYRIHRRESADEMLLNNAPENLWHEYARIMASKRFVAGALAARSLPVRVPLLLAPWECRILALCLRFGGAPKPQGLPPTASLMQLMATSIWTWPGWPWTRRLALSAWLVLMLGSPNLVGRRLALQHRSRTGAPQAPGARAN
jgi:hypothetical protein